MSIFWTVSIFWIISYDSLIYYFSFDRLTHYKCHNTLFLFLLFHFYLIFQLGRVLFYNFLIFPLINQNGTFGFFKINFWDHFEFFLYIVIIFFCLLSNRYRDEFIINTYEYIGLISNIKSFYYVWKFILISLY